MIISSSGRLIGVLYDCFGVGRCRAVATASKVRTLGGVGVGPSVVLLSVGVPHVSKVRMYHLVHDGILYPVLFLATEISRSSGVGKLLSNKSSCVAGPFDLQRLRTEVIAGVGERRERRRGARCHFVSRVLVSCSRGVMTVTKREVRFAGVRCRVVRFLSVRPKRIFSGRHVCTRIYKCSTRKSDEAVARLMQHVEGGVTSCSRGRCVRAM